MKTVTCVNGFKGANLMIDYTLQKGVTRWVVKIKNLYKKYSYISSGIINENI
jgi:hypothetical protein